MTDRPKMNEKAEAVIGKPSLGISGSVGGTPGKATGNGTPDTFSVEAIDSSEESFPAPNLPAYWNSNNLKSPF